MRRQAIVSNTAILLLGVWVFLTPWSMGLTQIAGEISTVGLSFWILGGAIFLCAASALVELSAWKEWTNFALGFVLLLAPYILGYEEVYYLFWNAIFPAFAIMAASLSGLEVAQRPPPPRPRPYLYLIRNFDT